MYGAAKSPYTIYIDIFSEKVSAQPEIFFQRRAPPGSGNAPTRYRKEVFLMANENMLPDQDVTYLNVMQALVEDKAGKYIQMEIGRAHV